MKSRIKLPLAVILATLAVSAFAQNASSEPSKDGRLRVQFVAREKTNLSSEIAAKVSSLPFREGDTFQAGQTLVGFDCALYKANLAKAEATADAARETLKVNRRLAELNSIGNLQVDQAAAKQKEAEAEATAMRVTVSKCTLRAPFSGRVAKVEVDPHEFVAPGKPLLEILDTRHLELQMIVPSRWLSWLKKGSPFSVHVDELSRDYTAKVIRLGARIDPVSQTIAMAARVEGDHPELLPGMSGWASMKAP